MIKLHQDKQVKEGLKEMKKYYKEYYDDQRGSTGVRDFLAISFKDEALLLRYLIGRKYNPRNAWDTIRYYAEVRFDKYPEMFPAIVPEKECFLVEEETPIFGVLKGRDRKGRRIIYFIGSKWDPDKHSIKEMTMASLPTFERLLLDEDCMKNGVVGVEECSEMGISHVKQHTLPAMLRLLYLYWYAHPIQVKGIYAVNVPCYASLIYGIIKPFLPKKLKERVLLTSRSVKFEELHQRISPDILPKHLGGQLEMKDAVDQNFLGFEL